MNPLGRTFGVFSKAMSDGMRDLAGALGAPSEEPAVLRERAERRGLLECETCYQPAVVRQAVAGQSHTFSCLRHSLSPESTGYVTLELRLEGWPL